MRDLLLDVVRSFSDRQVATRSAAIDAADEIPDDLVQAMRELDLIGLTTAELDVEPLLTVIEQLARACASVALLVVAPDGSVGEPRRTVGLRGLRTGAVSSTPDALFRYAVAAAAIGSAQYAHDRTVLYLSSRRAFGRNLIDIPVLHQTTSTLHASLTHARRAVHASARAEDASVVDAVTFEAARAATAVAYSAIQLHGGYGYMSEYPLERIARDCVSLRALVSTRSAGT
ncbi:MAG: acyl-CoA dehydrogenase family protein [Actinomycetota bacterium]|nr:acyl-CoA dehydrogenase family protein [Actinomycetota bacterium]